MSNSTEQRSPILRFLNAFFQEENIKWILGIGVCILLGSSLRLVTMHWNECTPVWKYLILLGYTGTVFPLGELSYHRLGLRKTGTVLLALTVLLIPLSFLALHWVRPGEVASVFDLLQNTSLTLLLGINLLWSSFAAHRIFRHFLREVQPTFLVSYLMLCVAGAVVPGLPTAWAPVLTLFLWAVFTAGTIKVNRHVFWLTEEHRLPRIFGFFPILLLGAQFAIVLAFGLASHLTVAWLGLLCTLIALPILLTADTVARVFEQRTGGLVRPIPWNISGPLLLGTTACVAGVVLTMTGFPASGAVVPTSAIAAVMMAIVARRTQKSAFVWGMVICAMISYQTSPVFFKEVALQIREQAAARIHESRLPYAFYGLTYAPLVVVFSVVAQQLQRRGQMLFADPLRQTACVLSWVLLGASFTHPTAILPVALVMCPLFCLQIVLFRQRLLLVPALVAFLAVAFGLPLFSERVWDLPFTGEVKVLIWAAAAGLLLVPGALVDRWVRLLPMPDDNPLLKQVSQSLSQLFSLAATVGVSLSWLWQFRGYAFDGEFDSGMLVTLVISALLVCHALRWVHTRLGEWSLVFMTYFAWCWIQPQQGTENAFIQSTICLFMGQWLLSYLLERWPETRLTRTYARPLRNVSFYGMSALFVLSACRWMLAHAAPLSVPLITGLVVLVWAFDAARRCRRASLAAVAWVSLLPFCSGILVDQFAVWNVGTWLIVWALTGFAMLAVRQILCHVLRFHEEVSFDWVSENSPAFHRGIEVCLRPLTMILPSLFLLIVMASFTVLDWPYRLAGGLGLAGLMALRQCRMGFSAFALFWPLLNWSLLAAVVTAYLPECKALFELTTMDLRACGLPLATCAAVSAWFFEWTRPRGLVANFVVLAAHQLLLSVTVIVLLAGAVTWHTSGAWPTIDLLYVAVTFLSVIGCLLMNAVRDQLEEHVWTAEAVLLGSLVYLGIAGAWQLTDPIFSYLCLLTGFAFWAVGAMSERSARLRILSVPFRSTGYWLPLAVVPLALYRHVMNFDASWAGVNSLPLLAAAAFYFWRGLERRQSGTLVLSAVILNLSTALLFRELSWTDPQLFLIPIGICVLGLMELLQQEIPAIYHDRLRMVGALLILVSPTFQIVSGSWMHILSLMVLSVVIGFLAIGLRIRVLLYTSQAFLLADLVSLVVRGSVDHPNLLWIVGVAFGAAVITLGAICENHRETVLGRLRGIAAEMETWR